MTPQEAARAVIGAALAQLQRNEDGALAGEDPEFVHQMRVALRRLRAALRVFRELVGRKHARRLDAALRSVARTAGLARDWDVFDTETLPHLMEHLGEEREGREVRPQVKSHRDAAREAMRAALRSPAHARLVLSLARWLVGPPGESGDEPLAAFASRAAARSHRKLARRAEGIDPFDSPRRHKLRIEAKRLRYTLDTFAGLFPPKPARAYLDALSDLQDDLGSANDAHVAAALVESLVIDPEPARRAREHLAAAERSQAARLPAHLEAILAARRFWED
jgi:CHAD domain-containing protein